MALLPDGFRASFEFRNPTWYDDDFYEVLRGVNATLVAADTGGEDDPPVVATAAHGYARIRKEVYEPGEFARWAETFKNQGWDHVFVFFKHEDEGLGPKLAQRFLDAAAD